jgi:hypothetical protein
MSLNRSSMWSLFVVLFLLTAGCQSKERDPEPRRGTRQPEAMPLAASTPDNSVRAAQLLSPVDDLLLYVERFTGAGPLECGRHQLVRRDRDWVTADEPALQKSMACGVKAAATNKAFWTFSQGHGDDSWGAVGLLGTGEGVIYRFTYDNAPCGGPGCPSEISFERCDKPAVVVTGSHKESGFRCAR